MRGAGIFEQAAELLIELVVQPAQDGGFDDIQPQDAEPGPFLAVKPVQPQLERWGTGRQVVEVSSRTCMSSKANGCFKLTCDGSKDT